MPLTDTFIKALKHDPCKSAGSKHSDGHGLYLHVKESGKYWRMAYRFAGKQKTLALGVYPAVGLAQARRRRDEAREQLASSIDPSLAKQVQKLALAHAQESTFEAVAREFHGIKCGAWSDTYAEKWLRNMSKDLFPHVGRMLLPEITPPLLLSVLRKVEKRGARETAHTLRQTAGQVFRYGIQTGRCERNPVSDLQGALEPIVVKHMAAVLEPSKAGELLRSIDEYRGQPTTKAALQLSALLFQRPGNIRSMEWDWIDAEQAMLTIPSMSMKRTRTQKLNGRPHLVPLARQALEVFEEIRPLTGHGKYVFPSLISSERPMSENTVNTALRRLGYSGEEMTAHGFRAMARTLLAERLPGIASDVVEAQLAHGKAGPLGAAYDRAEYMEQRRSLMQTWASYLEQLREQTAP
ncbi:MAG: integrase arm-type DNA-binding domain-containing protein [Delftia acidovorans]|uniref:tyrosine-type recombinase/integrase n=1 Tax=Polaromonas sp. TaxID=1869339 RepID=UPI001A4337A8|nr:integrase arm-type DNA-binding domain-containing protein [Delftia acidovorans]